MNNMYFTNDGWMYKLMALDPVSKLYFMISIVNPLEFDFRMCSKFLKTYC